MKAFKILSLGLLMALPLAANALPQVRVSLEKAEPRSWQEFWTALSGKLTAANADLTVVVTDAATGLPLPSTTVLVGMAEGIPFAENKVQTDQEGMAFFAADELKNGAALSVTAKHAGYGIVTLAELQGNRVELALSRDPDANAYAFYQGKVLGFPPGYGSNIIETGFFVPAISAPALLSFNLQTMLSSYTVEMDIYGKRIVPGNVVFPDQRKSYILPIRMNKPEFIMPLSKDLSSRMTAIVGALPISAAMGALQNKDYLEVMNLTTITHAVWTDRIDVSADARFDLTVKEPLQQQKIFHSFSGIAPKMDVAGVALLAPGGDKQDLIPMDVKSLNPSQVQNGNGSLKLAALAQPNAGDQFYVFSGMLDRKRIDDKLLAPGQESNMSGALNLVPSSGQVSVNGFLRPMGNLTASPDRRVFHFSSPTNRAAAIAADFIQLNLYSDTANALTRGATRRLVWSVVMPGTASTVQLPRIDNLPVFQAPDRTKQEKFFMELTAVQNSNTNGVLDTKVSVDKLKYISRTLELL